MIYAIHDLLLLKERLSIAVIEGSTKRSETNKYPIVDILSFISVEMVFNRLSKGRLHGIDNTAGQDEFTIILTICIKKSM